MQSLISWCTLPDPHLAGAGTKVAADLLIQDENEDKK